MLLPSKAWRQNTRYIHSRGRGHLFFTRLLRFIRQYRLPLLLLTLAAAVEVYTHGRQYAITQPDHDLDAPFYTQCQEPAVNQPREKAALFMLVRNRELEKAFKTVRSIEKHFNQWFHYPIVFLNDEPWTDEFMTQMNATASGGVKFEVLTRQQWTFPEWMDVGSAKASIGRQGRAGILYAGMESYHHMCRFYSGNFYTLPALQDYTWYWRIEPDVDFHCAITYDPFVEMARHNKTYGFTIALAEEARTCPSLFRQVSSYKEAHQLPTTTLWSSLISPSWAPWPLRSLLPLLPHRDTQGDAWNLCHYWSNFEIANLDFFRGDAYQNLFAHLDRAGGFYHERWGDAPVHSLALAMLLDAEQVHHFQDIGYRHDWYWQCPVNAPGQDAQLVGSVALKRNAPWAEEGRDGDGEAVGCRCECDAKRVGVRNYPGLCQRRLKVANRGRDSGSGMGWMDWLWL